MSKNATVNSVGLAFVSCFLITWVNEASSLTGYSDLLSFVFVTKAIGTFITLTGMNLYLAKQTFRPDDSKTRKSDPSFIETESSGSDIRTVLNRRTLPKE